MTPAPVAPAAPYFEELLARLETLRGLDPERSVFGSGSHGHALAPPLSEDEVAAFEQAHGVSLPADYRAFLRHAGAGGAGPAYGLKPLAAWERDALPQVVSTITTKSGETFSAGTGPRESLERPASPALPFLLTEAWTPVDGEGEAVPLPLPEGVNPYDGCLQLADIGCGYFYFLVITGEGRGQVWEDYTAADGAIGPTGKTFLQWYEDWLDGTLRDELLRAVRSAFTAEQRAGAGAPGSAPERPLAPQVKRFLPLFAAEWERGKLPNDAVGLAFMHLYLDNREEALRLLAEIEDDAPQPAAEIRLQLYKDELAAVRATPPREVAACIGHPVTDIRRTLARNPATPESALFELAGDADAGVLQAVAAHASSSPRVIARLFDGAAAAWAASHDDTAAVAILELVARHAATTPAMRVALSQWDHDAPAGSLADVVVRSAALCPETPAAELTRLAAHAAPWIRHGVALNPGAPGPILEALVKDPHRAVRAAVGANAGAPVGALVAMARHPEVELRAAVAGNARLPLEEINLLACEPTYEVACAVARNPALPERARACLVLHPQGVMPPPGGDSRRQDEPPLLADGRGIEALRRAAVEHPSFPVARLDAHLDAVEGHPPAASLHPVVLGRDPSVAAYAMASNPWLSDEQIARLADHSYAYTRSRIASRPDTSADVLAVLGVDAQGMVQAAVAANPRTPVARAIELSRSEDKDVRTGAAQHPGLPVEVLRVLAADGHNWARRAVIWNPSTPVELLAKLAADPDENVRRWVSGNLATPRALVETLAQDENEKVRAFATWRKVRDALAAWLAAGSPEGLGNEGAALPGNESAASSINESAASPSGTTSVPSTIADSPVVTAPAPFTQPPPDPTPAQRRVLAIAAILNERNGDDHVHIGGAPRPSATGRAAYSLAKWWNVRSTREAEGILQWLADEGHRDQFSQGGGLSPESFLGWDYGRMASFAGQAYVAQWLDAETAWQWMRRAALELQKAFGSFAELGQSYLRGLRAWSYDGSKAAIETEAVIAKLHTRAGSPFLLPWKLDIGDAPAPVVAPREIRVAPGDSIADAIVLAGADGRVILEPGEHEGSFTLPHSIELVAAEPGKAILTGAADGPVLRVNRGIGVVARGLVMRSRRTADDESLNAIHVNGGFALLQDCDIRATHHGVAVVGNGDARLVGCRVHDCGKHGVIADPGDLVLHDVEIRNAGMHGVSRIGGGEPSLLEDVRVIDAAQMGVFAAGSVIVRGLRVESPGQAGLVVAGSAVVQKAAIVGSKGRGIMVQQDGRLELSDSEISGGPLPQLDVLDGLAQVSRTTLKGGTGGAILVQPSGRAHLFGCELESSEHGGIFAMAGARMVVLHCDIKAAWGIATDGASGWIMAGSVESSSGRAIDILSGEGMTVADCTIRSHAAEGVVVRDDASTRLLRCTIAGCGGAGLVVGAGAKVLLEDGTRHDNGAPDRTDGGALTTVVATAPALVTVTCSDIDEGEDEDVFSLQVTPIAAWDALFQPRGAAPEPAIVAQALLVGALGGSNKAQHSLDDTGGVTFRVHTREEAEQLRTFVQTAAASPTELRALVDGMTVRELGYALCVIPER